MTASVISSSSRESTTSVAPSAVAVEAVGVVAEADDALDALRPGAVDAGEATAPSPMTTTDRPGPAPPRSGRASRWT